MRIATWNVNSVRAREQHVRAWLVRQQPDLLMLQETKCEAAQFPDFSDLGYRAETVGQKSYNGVAVLGRIPFETTERALPGRPWDDNQSRYIEVEAAGATFANLYLPNGNSGGEDGYQYKLNWMDALRERARALLDARRDCAFLGDYNCCPTAEDFASGTLRPDDALVRPETRSRYRSLLWLGLTDAARALQPSGPAYTFWDYQAGAWRRNAGLRIDFALLSPVLAERLLAAVPDRAERTEPQPSDHVPLVVDLADA